MDFNTFERMFDLCGVGFQVSFFPSISVSERLSILNGTVVKYGVVDNVL